MVYKNEHLLGIDKNNVSLTLPFLCVQISQLYLLQISSLSSASRHLLLSRNTQLPICTQTWLLAHIFQPEKLGRRGVLHVCSKHSFDLTDL